MRYICVDAFSGGGGLSIGLIRAGFEIIAAFDNNIRCIETQRLNPQYIPHPAYLANIDDMLGGKLIDQLKIKKGDLFLLAGGPPCQGFSIQRIGEDVDERNDLINKYIDLVGELYPEYFLMENVPGITGKRGHEILKRALERAYNLGYWIMTKTLDAQFFGVPQRRRRVFIVGEKRKNGENPKFQFPDSCVSSTQKITVKSVIGHLPPPPENGKDHPAYPHHRKDRLSKINLDRLAALKSGEGMDHLPSHLVAKCHKIGSSVIGHRNVYGRMSWDNVAPTITARFDSFTRGQFGHPEQPRSITLREGALLQTFPEDFLFSGTKVEVASQIGNAVPPRLAEILGKQLIRYYDSKVNSSLSQ